MLLRILLLLIFLSLSSPWVWGLDRFRLEPGTTVVGEILRHTVSANETLLDIARLYDLGYNQIVLANPGIDPWLPPEGKKVLIPRMFVLPPGPHTGILINLPEMRLYYFRNEGGTEVVYTAPIGIGTEGRLTTEGVYTIYRKKVRPYWHVPESIRKEDPSLPPVVPPGPDNPLGDYALYLSREAYAIHGTNRPWGIGRRVSHGCIRLYPEDIEALFPLVPVGTPVRVIYEPFKLGIRKNQVFLQVYPDIENRIPTPILCITRQASILENQLGKDIWIDFFRVRKQLEKKDGVPRIVGEVR